MSTFVRRLPAALIALAAVGAMLAASVAVAEAHERREVEGYTLVVGWIVEPAFEGLKNGVDLRVTRDGEPVEGVQETLEVEVTYNDTGTSRTVALRTIFNDPGHYTSDLVPTSPGDYTFRLTGTIEGVQIDEAFDSADGGFNSVHSVSEIHFPETVPGGRELQGAVLGASSDANSAASDASSARTMAVAALALGVLGLVAGGGALAMALTNRRA